MRSAWGDNMRGVLITQCPSMLLIAAGGLGGSSLATS
jgi:hypothetical protein